MVEHFRGVVLKVERGGEAEGEEGREKEKGRLGRVFGSRDVPLDLYCSFSCSTIPLCLPHSCFGLL